MITTDLRIKAENEADAVAAVAFLKDMFGAAIRLRAPRAGSNPKYADRQAWMSYGTLDFEPGVALVAARARAKPARKASAKALPKPAKPKKASAKALPKPAKTPRRKGA